MNYEDVMNELHSLSDEKYKAFSERIVNTRLRLYGVRTPDLRKLARRIKKEYTNFAHDFFAKDEYCFEEVLLCGWQMGKDASENVRLLKRLIPRMASWAHTDQIISHFNWVRDKQAFLQEFQYLKAGSEYEVRAYVMFLFSLCVNERDLPLVISELPTVPLGAYYVDMAVAWLVCEVTVKFYTEGLKLLKADYLSPWVVNKAISKCRDSFRLTLWQKEELKGMRR